ncbi:hypothetical protein JOF56_006096 [Kibdelosporangium banguiense]|uniref:Uncharacterized protein n=1 Tax=Kibdelosporangium banguiense TaxID=1365924 RepID=A0ABS4TMR9_9PSEU|nr:hypothetical protein [Kibdelosporangium banguiense]MBP2325711.1 hypothetical protein [Kibdelosporangium banguiense]
MRTWPFLVARGRRSGYRVLLAPDFLISQYGFLEDIAGSGPRTVVTTVGGRKLTVVWSEHTVTGPDIGTEDAPRDEHSRPLHLLHGFVSPDAVQPSEVDFDQSLQAALDTYRRFLTDEEQFTVEASASLQPDSSAPAGPPSVPRKIFPVVLVGLAAVVTVAVITIIAVTSLTGEQPPVLCPSTTVPTAPAPVTSVPLRPSC